MDLQYGIAVTNKFSLFIDEDEDPLEILRQKEEEAKTSKKDDKKNKSKSAKKAAAATENKPKQQEQQVTKRDGKLKVECTLLPFILLKLFSANMGMLHCCIVITVLRHFEPCGLSIR